MKNNPCYLLSVREVCSDAWLASMFLCACINRSVEVNLKASMYLQSTLTTFEIYATRNKNSGKNEGSSVPTHCGAICMHNLMLSVQMVICAISGVLNVFYILNTS
ncbi:hypothetical protein BDBG_17445 [Blastomyces gilchristii SLH14081]|uniref:Uncharacterized protein n=2 Tax=Blastomyces TaxID=229219 RepID=A0A179UVB7_BLAGS|nr:uncharacterized protein BDBG_17445 [Blastomyces gilchristii SLH14081]KMW66852.1 hypothetical protein BDDG_11751 [Blastomyces dermatitidis ATCC 18188]OAT11037.1 hypothetical protein BDBG_17445 [Blastomyces gilchristii SLH14081]